ncbi:MAG: hypothetical protein AAF708_09740 [Deinococcota bacterium]
MESPLAYDILGYCSTAIIAYSLMLRSMTKLRVVNALGCIGYITYGILVDTFPVVVLNTVIFLTHLFYLRGHVASLMNRTFASSQRTPSS